MKLSFEFKIFCNVIVTGLLIFCFSGCHSDKDNPQSQLSGYPIDSDVYTTRDQTVIADEIPADSEGIYPYEISKFTENGYGVWHFEDGIDAGKQVTLMPEGYTGEAVTHTASLLNFFTITDVHIADEETPVSGILAGYHGGNSSGYSPVMMLTTQVLDAAVQTINALHQQKAFDFGMAIGDAANGSQYNELRWYIDILDGQDINPDSGDKDDPVPGPYNDYQDEFKAAGLDHSIPWYQTIGNHDHAWLGTYPVTDYFRAFYTGSEILLMGDLFAADGPENRTDFMGAIDGSTPDGSIIGVGPVADFTTDGILTLPTTPADADRRPLSRTEWMKEFFNTTSNPVGHGFSQDNIDNDFACYSFEPKSDIPIKVIVLDDTQLFDVANMDEYFDIHENGYISQSRFNWLIGELNQGQAEGKLMIISAHIPIAIIGMHPPVVPYSIDSTTLLTKLSQYPNLILWIAGHRHRNVVTPRPSIDPAYPGEEYGFWEVETASLRDFPQQFRTFEIVRNSDNTLSIITTDVDPAVKVGSLAAKSRSYAVAADILFNQTHFLPPSEAYNAELVKQLSPEMQVKIQSYGTPMGK
ncbi:MAG: TIGR03768 family metallophosphoesterase [Desulfobacteraceae bacterium]|jgi:metallophosphoesterase (TIGR03768 family)